MSLHRRLRERPIPGLRADSIDLLEEVSGDRIGAVLFPRDALRAAEELPTLPPTVVAFAAEGPLLYGLHVTPRPGTDRPRVVSCVPGSEDRGEVAPDLPTFVAQRRLLDREQPTNANAARARIHVANGTGRNNRALGS